MKAYIESEINSRPSEIAYLEHLSLKILAEHYFDEVSVGCITEWSCEDVRDTMAPIFDGDYTTTITTLPSADECNKLRKQVSKIKSSDQFRSIKCKSFDAPSYKEYILPPQTLVYWETINQLEDLKTNCFGKWTWLQAHTHEKDTV
jgi:hypothetical protein